MKEQLQAALVVALEKIKVDKFPDISLPENIQIEHTKDKKFGDFSSNIAMVLTKQAKMPPRELATLIAATIDTDIVEKTEIAGPGFINFFLASGSQNQIINTILEKGENYGRSDLGKGKKVHIEFVSANPTGPLHVGHGRGAAFGAAVAELLDAVGYDVHREYYVNDAGRQMHILATSVWLRYLELCGESLSFPSNGYQGEYVLAIAKQVFHQFNKALHHPLTNVFANVPADEGQDGGDKEAHIDALVRNAKALLGNAYPEVFAIAKDDILADIKNDLSGFRVNYQEWFSEQSLVDNNALEVALNELRSQGLLYEEEGALWFKATNFGDDKDRVIQKENGELTYFANDIAYHSNKYQRGFDIVVDIFGADHHGYIPRIKAMLEAFGHDINDFSALLVQFAILYRGEKRVQMSTRSGSFVTLRELREEVGDDAARFFYVMRKNEQHMDFDLDLAKSQSNDNPVYYVQYAHARVCSVMRQLAEKGLKHDEKLGNENLGNLTEEQETKLINKLARYPEIVTLAAKSYGPHHIANYLRELANDFHAYYNAHQFIIEDEKLRNSRLNLIKATKQTLANGLKLLGVSAPERM